MKTKSRMFSRIKTGSKKLASVNMRKEEHQFVIDGYLVDEVLKQIPAEMKIIQAYVHLIKREKERRIIVPNALRKFGVTAVHESAGNKKAAMIFDQINKNALKSNVASACKALNLPYEKAYFRYIVIANPGGAVKFVHCTKEIKPDELDQRKKLRVLGATEGQGKVQDVITQLNAKKYRCVIKEEPVKFIMCSKV